MTVRKFFTALICLLPIPSVKPCLLRMLGHRVCKGAKIGFALILVDKLFVGGAAKISFGSVIRVRRLVLKDGSQVRKLNFISGNFDLWMDKGSFILNLNIITRGYFPEADRRPKLRLGTGSQISTLCSIDLAETVWIGEDTVLGGKGIQIWTHGFVHLRDRSRHLICGRVTFGNNVYVGARSCIGPGIRIVDDVAIGAQSSVAKDINEPDLYVSAPLRRISGLPDERLLKFAKITNAKTQQSYFRKMHK